MISKKIICYPLKDNRKRFLLGRKGNSELLAVGLNPSTANESSMDPTSKNIESIANQNGFDGWWLVNLYPGRYPKPKDLPKKPKKNYLKQNLTIINKIIQSEEFRIKDVLYSDDVNIYRQLGGGLTTANILHGSANPIGGQNAVIKLRWGSNANQLLFKNAPEGIKFALGENVKQANWGGTNRYPQTRMGVEQVMRDAFRAALDYKHANDNYMRNAKYQRTKIPPRKDLELDALVEILEGERLVHCHSYRQDEILMLTRVAEDFGFKIATFQHVLEGYKVADRLAEHGAGASTFSDWWQYKYEVIDAIPYNGSMMVKSNVLVSFNSDDDELARRLNTEAAKAIQYGNLDPNEALKLVTINPAKQLKIDKYVGSLEPKKDADFVIWDGEPLSIYSKVEETWIDGIRYYSQKDNKLLEERDAELRSNIIQKILSTKGPSTFSSSKKSSSMHNGHKCDILDNTGVYDD